MIRSARSAALRVLAIAPLVGAVPWRQPVATPAAWGVRTGSPRSDTIAQMIDCVRAASAVNGLSAGIWPGFRLAGQVMMVASEQPAVTVLAASIA